MINLEHISLCSHLLQRIVTNYCYVVVIISIITVTEKLLPIKIITFVKLAYSFHVKLFDPNV